MEIFGGTVRENFFPISGTQMDELFTDICISSAPRWHQIFYHRGPSEVLRKRQLCAFTKWRNIPRPYRASAFLGGCFQPEQGQILLPPPVCSELFAEQYVDILCFSVFYIKSGLGRDVGRRFLWQLE